MVAVVLGVTATSVMALRESRARRLADRSAEIATKSAGEADRARSATLREAYQARLAAAMGAIGNHDVHEAARQLKLAPEALRGWEWRHIQGRLDQSLAVVTGLPSTGNIAFCPPGERCAVAAARGFRVLDAVTGKSLAVDAVGQPCHQVFALQTRGGWLFALDQSDQDYVLALVDEHGKPLGRIRRPNPDPTRMPSVSALAMSPDGTRVALQTMPYSEAPLIEVFDAKSGKPVATCGGGFTNLLGLEFSPDSTRIAAVLERAKVFLFDAATGDLVATLRGHIETVRAVAYSPDGRRLASCGDDQTIRIWDATTGDAIATLHGEFGRVTCVAFSPDGRRLASGHVDSSVRVWSTDGEAPVVILQGHTANVTRVSFSADGRTIASAAADGTARLWDAMSRDDPRVLRAHSWHVYPVAYSRDGRRFATGSWDRTVRLWDAASGRPVLVLRGHTRPIGVLAFTRDGTALVSWAEDGTIRLWDADTGRLIGTLIHTSMKERDSVYSLVVTSDGERIGAVTTGGLRFWDAASRRELTPLRLPIQGVRVVTCSPDGARLAAGGDDPRVAVVDAASGELITELTGFTGRIQALQFSPDGRHLLTAGLDGVLRLWDAANGRLERSFFGHSLEVLAAVFHPDGTRIASGGHDRSILVWDVSTGEALARLPGHSSYVFSLAFSPDGKTLVSGSGDSTVRLWDDFAVARRLQARRVLGSPLPPYPLADRPSSSTAGPRAGDLPVRSTDTGWKPVPHPSGSGIVPEEFPDTRWNPGHADD
jgi:WD40 repeat protein